MDWKPPPNVGLLLRSTAARHRRPESEVPAAKVEECRVRHDADRLRQVGIHSEGVYSNEHGGKIEQVSRRENRQEARESRQHCAQVPKCPSPVKEEADGESDYIATDVGKYITKTERPLAQVDGEQAN